MGWEAVSTTDLTPILRDTNPPAELGGYGISPLYLGLVQQWTSKTGVDDDGHEV